VRCTSCKNVFQVRKSGVVPQEAPAPGPGSTVEMSPLDAAALARPPPRSSAPPPARSNPPATAARPAAGSSNGAARKVDTDDLFGMSELTGEAPAAKARTTPASAKPAKAAAKPMPNFDDIDIEVDERARPLRRPPEAPRRRRPEASPKRSPS